MSIHHRDDADDQPTPPRAPCGDPLSTDAWTLVLSHLSMRDVTSMALVCRSLHTATLRDNWLLDVFTYSMCHDDIIAAAMLACTSTSLATLDSMLVAQRTRALEPAEMPWLWQTVLRRLVCRQQRESRNSRLFLHPALPRWKQLLDRMGDRVSVVPCMFLAASVTNNVAIIDAFAELEVVGEATGASVTHSNMLRAGVRIGGLEVARTLRRLFYALPNNGTSLFPFNEEYEDASQLALTRRIDDFKEIIEVWDDSAALEVLYVAMAMGDMTMVRRWCELPDFDREHEELEDVVGHAFMFRSHETMDAVVAAIGVDKLQDVDSVWMDALSNGNHRLVQRLGSFEPYLSTVSGYMCTAIETANPMCVRALWRAMSPGDRAAMETLDVTMSDRWEGTLTTWMVDELDSLGILRLDQSQHNGAFLRWLFCKLDDQMMATRVIARWPPADEALAAVNIEEVPIGERSICALGHGDTLSQVRAEFIMKWIVENIDSVEAFVRAHRHEINWRQLVHRCQNTRFLAVVDWIQTIIGPA